MKQDTLRDIKIATIFIAKSYPDVHSHILNDALFI
uniref:Uncharacterized protein n=1 Tax=Anguilla anguilla TaxID=7936 RepID=A0A0E9RU44_ANGAN